MYCIDVLAPYLPENPQCLELFARNLTPGWTSWGNEVLNFQRCLSEVFILSINTPCPEKNEAIVF